MISRRRWLSRTSAAAGSMLSARGWSSLIHASGPASRLRVGVIGTGVRGKYLIGNLPEHARVEAVCDCSTSRIVSTLQPRNEFVEILSPFRDQQAAHCATFQDYRRMIDEAKLDAVIIATPDHHHVPAALTAFQAGLDVYLEKPLSVSIAEGRMLADTVRRTRRVLQVGSQQRSMEMNRFACEFIRDGGLGKISHVDFPNFPGPMPVPDYPAEPIPRGLDWDLFLGPAQTRAHHRNLWVKDEFKVGTLLWRGWDLFEDFSGHLMTNWGGHSIDMVQYALGMDESGPIELMPDRDVSESELEQDWLEKWNKKTPPPAGDWNTDDRFRCVTVTYPGGLRVRLRPGVSEATFHGERGTMLVRRNGFTCRPASLITEGPDPHLATLWDGDGHVARPHLQNWLDCIGTRSTPRASAEIGHRTATVCHLVNLTRRLNRRLVWDPSTESFIGDEEANLERERPRRDGWELPSSA